MRTSDEPAEARVEIYHARTGDRPRFSYPVRVLRWGTAEVIVSGVFGPEVEGRSPIFRPGDVTGEFFWNDRWWNVVAGYDAATGDLRGYYCNVAKPAHWSTTPAPRIAYTDLDLDLVVFPDGDLRVEDEDEFARYSSEYAYPEGTIARAQETIRVIIERIRQRADPFRFESLPALCARLDLPLPATITHEG